MESYQYDAFISYRHAEPDREAAELLHKRLETFKVPKALIKKGSQKKVGRVFRDRDELPTSSNLADNIYHALENSEHLIVICSPRTPQSQWVCKEIETFAALHGHDRILALLIEGEPQESFPEPLRFIRQTIALEDGSTQTGCIEVEPLAADIRAGSLKEMKKKLKTEILRLLAPILNCRFDDLKQRHRERTVKRILAASISFSLFFLLFGSFSAYQAMLIKHQSDLVSRQIQKTLQGQSLYMADISARLLQEGDRFRAIMVAREALPEDLSHPDRPYMEEAEYALNEALGVYQVKPGFYADIALNHSKPVNALAVSPDAKAVATAADDGFIYLWDPSNGKLLHKLKGGQRDVHTGTLSYVGPQSLVYLNNEPYSLICLDTSTLQEKWRYDYIPTCIEFCPDKSKAALAGNDLIILDTADGKELWTYDLHSRIQSMDAFGAVCRLAFEPSGRFVAVGLSNGAILVFDLLNRQLSLELKAPYNSIDSIAISEDGKIAFSSHEVADVEDISLFSKSRSAVSVYALQPNQLLVENKTQGSPIRNLRFAPDDTNLLTCTESELLKILDIRAKQVTYSFVSGDTISDYIFMDGLLLAASSDGSLRVFVTDGGGYEYTQYRLSLPGSLSSLQRNGFFAVTRDDCSQANLIRFGERAQMVSMAGLEEYPSEMDQSSDGKKLLTYAGGMSETALWDAASDALIGTFMVDGSIQSACFADGDRKILVSTQKGITLYDTATLKTVSTITADEDAGVMIDPDYLSPDGTRLVLRGYDGIKLVRLSDMHEIQLQNDGFVMEVHWISHERFIVTGDDGFDVYNAASGSLEKTVEIPGIQSLTPSSDGKQIAVVTGDNRVEIMDTASFQVVHSFSGFDLSVVSALFDPQGARLFVALDDYSIQCWELDGGKLLAELKGNETHLDRILFDEKDTCFITVGTSKDAVIWRSSYKKVGRLSGLMGVARDFGAFYCPQYKGIAKLRFYSTQDLIDESARQLGGAVLSEEDREAFFITE